MRKFLLATTLVLAPVVAAHADPVPATLHDGLIRVEMHIPTGNTGDVEVGVGDVTGATYGAHGRCIVDTGASDLTIPTDVADKLLAANEAAVTGQATYTTANGKLTQKTLSISTVTVGGAVQHDVKATVAVSGGPCLLGQSFFQRYGAVAQNFKHGWLILFP